MKKSVAFGVLITAVVFSWAFPHPSVAAPSSAPTPVPVTRPDFSSMRFLLGTWTCRQLVRGKSRPDTSTTSIGLDGAYMISHDVAPPFDKYRTQAVKSDSYTTYNLQKHQWVSLNMDSFGGYGVSTSPGWNGKTMTSTVVLSQDGTTGSDTLTKISDTQTRDVYVSHSPSGAVQRGTVTCTKS